MILDTFLEFADAEDVSAAAGTADFGAIDLGAAGVEIAGSMNMYLVISVNTAFTSAGAALVEFQLVSDAQDPIADDGTATLHASTGAIPFDDLTKGKRFVMQLPFSPLAYERYLGLLVITSGATTTAGAIDAFLTTTPQTWEPKPEAVS